MVKSLERCYSLLDISKVIPKEHFFIHDVDGVEFGYCPLAGSIAVNLSGGADSALGTYILCKMIQELNLDTTVEVITFVRGAWGKPWQKPIAEDVFNKLKSMFPDIIQEQHFHFLSPSLEHGTLGKIDEIDRSIDQMIVGDYNFWFSLVEEKADVIYNFTTRNPPEVSGGMNDRDVKNLTEEWYSAAAIRPFNSVTKDWVIKQYVDNEIMDLLEVTRSCEMSIDNKLLINLNVEYNSKSLPTCGKCFWCKEKEWAMRQNGIC